MFGAATLRRLEVGGLIVTAALIGLAMTQLAYLTQPIAPLAVAAALGVILLAITRPMVALYLAIALTPLELLSFSLGPGALSPAEGMLVVTGVGWAASRVVRGGVPFSPSPLGKPLAALILAVVPGIAISPEPVDVIKILVMWTSFLLLYQMIITEGGPHSVRNILIVLMLSAAIVGTVAIVQSGGEAADLRGVGDTAKGRAQGSFGHPNALATFEALALPGALALGLTGSAALRALGLGSFALIFGGLALSLSRGGLLAVAGALSMMLIWRPFRRTAIAAALVVLVLGVNGANPLGDTQQVQVLAQRLQSTAYSAGGADPRFRVWDVAQQMIVDHPLLGIGANAFPATAPRYGLLGPASLSTYEHPHNIALTFAVEQGLVGLAVFIWLVVALVLVLVRGLGRTPPEQRGMLVAVAAAFVAIGLQGMVDYTLRSNFIVAAIFILAACAVVLGRGEPAGLDDRPEPAGDDTHARPRSIGLLLPLDGDHRRDAFGTSRTVARGHRSGR